MHKKFAQKVCMSIVHRMEEETEDQTGSQPVERREVQLDGRQIRVLAHPLRTRLLGALRLDGPATATTLAQALGTNTGATSYHLRQLAEVGLVYEEPDRGTARQRWWRAAHDLSSWRATDFDDDPDASAASDWIQAFQVRRTAEESERWVRTQRDWPRPWREVSGFSDYVLRLTPEQLRALNEEISQVIARYDRESRAADQSGPGSEGAAPGREDRTQARDVILFYASFPWQAEAAGLRRPADHPEPAEPADREIDGREPAAGEEPR